MDILMLHDASLTAGRRGPAWEARSDRTV